MPLWRIGVWGGGAVGAVFISYLVLARKRLGELNVASWLVIFGAIVVLTEHPHMAVLHALSPDNALAPDIVSDHDRIHTFMAGVYALIGLVLLCVIARTLLREGKRAGWYAILFALVVGGVFDLVMDGLWYRHGFTPLLFGRDVEIIGWQWLYLYPVAWIAALTISYRPIFGKPLGSPH